jgi:hypothetical protein
MSFSAVERLGRRSKLQRVESKHKIKLKGHPSSRQLKHKVADLLSEQICQDVSGIICQYDVCDLEDAVPIFFEPFKVPIEAARRAWMRIGPRYVQTKDICALQTKYQIKDGYFVTTDDISDNAVCFCTYKSLIIHDVKNETWLICFHNLLSMWANLECAKDLLLFWSKWHSPVMHEFVESLDNDRESAQKLIDSRCLIKN